MIDNMWYAMFVLAGPRLMISACVEDSAGKHISGAWLGCSAVGFGRWDGARLRKYFSAYVLQMFHVCIYGIITRFYAYAFKYLFLGM